MGAYRSSVGWPVPERVEVPDAALIEAEVAGRVRQYVDLFHRDAGGHDAEDPVWAICPHRRGAAHRILRAQIGTAQAAKCGVEPHPTFQWDEAPKRARRCKRCRGSK